MEEEEQQEFLEELRWDPDLPIPDHWMYLARDLGVSPDLFPLPSMAVEIWQEHNLLGEPIGEIMAREGYDEETQQKLRDLILIAEGVKNEEQARQHEARMEQSKASKK